jgi:hypothetical protein
VPAHLFKLCSYLISLYPIDSLGGKENIGYISKSRMLVRFALPERVTVDLMKCRPLAKRHTNYIPTKPLLLKPPLLFQQQR